MDMGWISFPVQTIRDCVLPPSQKKQVTLEFKNCLKKQIILPYLESVCACKNQLVPNMDSK